MLAGGQRRRSLGADVAPDERRQRRSCCSGEYRVLSYVTQHHNKSCFTVILAHVRTRSCMRVMCSVLPFAMQLQSSMDLMRSMMQQQMQQQQTMVQMMLQAMLCAGRPLGPATTFAVNPPTPTQLQQQMAQGHQHSAVDEQRERGGQGRRWWSAVNRCLLARGRWGR